MYINFKDVIPQELLDRLKFEIQMTASNEFDVIRHVAHSIPAIVFTFGSSKWVFIKSLYLLLADHYQVSFIKKTKYYFFFIVKI